MLHSIKLLVLGLLSALALYLVVFVPETSVILFVFVHSTCFLWVLAVRFWLRSKYGKGLWRLTEHRELHEWPVRCLFIALIVSWLYLMVDGARGVEAFADRYIDHYESETVEEFTSEDLVERRIYYTGNSLVDCCLTDYRFIAAITLAINLVIQYFGLREYYRRRRVCRLIRQR